MVTRTHKKPNTIFYNVVTIFFRLQRKLEEKNYLFKDSCPEETTLPIPLDQSSLDHLSRPYLIPEIKRNKKTKRGTNPFKILLQPFFIHN